MDLQSSSAGNINHMVFGRWLLVMAVMTDQDRWQKVSRSASAQGAVLTARAMSCNLVDLC